MNTKPKITEVLEIMSMKNQVSKLYEKIDKRVAQIKKECGAGRYDYDLETLIGLETLRDQQNPETKFAIELKEKGQYFKFEIEDNATKLLSGEAIFKSVSLKPVSFSSRSLKRCPETLKPTKAKIVKN